MDAKLVCQTVGVALTRHGSSNVSLSHIDGIVVIIVVPYNQYFIIVQKTLFYWEKQK
jgi:hypothetical protein